MYDQQTRYFNQKLKEAQEEHHAARKAMMKAMNEENQLRVRGNNCRRSRRRTRT